MRHRVRQKYTMVGFSVLLGTLLTLSLFLSISILASNRSKNPDQHPLLVVDLMSWSTPQKQTVPPPLQQVKPKRKPKPKRVKPAIPKKELKTITKKAPDTRKLQEKIPDDPAPVETEIPIELPPTKITSNEETDSIPIPTPTFRLTHSPRFIHRETPVYPEIMRNSGSSGIVKLEILIDKTGRVRNINITKSAGQYFDAAAKNAIFASSFFPAKIGSEPVAALLRLPVKFSIL